MTTKTPPHPSIVSRADWLARRLELLRHEKELTKQHDQVAAERRHLPMVRVDRDYVFDTPTGQRSLRELFEGRRQLIVYHFMFGPDWEKGCPGCTGYVDALGDLAMLAACDTSFTLISRAPLAQLEAYKKLRGWNRPWVSSFGSDFNYDYHVTLDEKVAPPVYNYETVAEMKAKNAPNPTEGEVHGFSVFFRMGDEVYHTYSTYARGAEGLTHSYSLLDTTPYGRQQDWEDSQPGWPQKPTYG